VEILKQISCRGAIEQTMLKTTGLVYHENMAKMANVYLQLH